MYTVQSSQVPTSVDKLASNSSKATCLGDDKTTFTTSELSK